MGRRKNKYFVYRIENNELIFSSPYFEDCETYITDELGVNSNGSIEDYYMTSADGKIINIEYFENEGWA